MAGNGSLFDVQSISGAHVLRFCRRGGVGLDCVRQVRQEISRLRNGRGRIKIVLDLEQATSLSSEAIGMILALTNVISPRGGQLHLANLSKETYAAFDILMLRSLVRIFGSVQDAIECFE